MHAKGSTIRSMPAALCAVGTYRLMIWASVILENGCWMECGQKTLAPTSSLQNGFPVRIRCGLECESSTNGKELFKDLAKLIVVASEIKIFAAGMTQKSVEGAANYVGKRVSQIDRLLDHVHDEERATDWYLAFWPAPFERRRKIPMGAPGQRALRASFVDPFVSPIWEIVPGNGNFSTIDQRSAAVKIWAGAAA